MIAKFSLAFFSWMFSLVAWAKTQSDADQHILGFFHIFVRNLTLGSSMILMIVVWILLTFYLGACVHKYISSRKQKTQA
jgi:hypothetical protein